METNMGWGYSQPLWCSIIYDNYFVLFNYLKGHHYPTSLYIEGLAKLVRGGGGGGGGNLVKTILDVCFWK